jgi:hypothetical protein
MNGIRTKLTEFLRGRILTGKHESRKYVRKAGEGFWTGFSNFFRYKKGLVSSA